MYVRTKDKEVPHILCCRYVLSKLEYEEMYTGKIVLSEKVILPLFGNVLRHNFIPDGNNKPHSGTARTHKGQFHVTCVFVFCVLSIKYYYGFSLTNEPSLVHCAYVHRRNFSYRYNFERVGTS
jgi:hypothetical protein